MLLKRREQSPGEHGGIIGAPEDFHAEAWSRGSRVPCLTAGGPPFERVKRAACVSLSRADEIACSPNIALGSILRLLPVPGGPVSRQPFGILYRDTDGRDRKFGAFSPSEYPRNGLVALWSAAPEPVTEAIYAATRRIRRYHVLRDGEVDIDRIGQSKLGGMVVDVLDPIADYAELMESLFDFTHISELLTSGRFRMRQCTDR